MWYSPVPWEAANVPNSMPAQSSLREVQVESRTFTVMTQDEHHGVILAMRSSDPMDYLRPEWQPGATLEF